MNANRQPGGGERKPPSLLQRAAQALDAGDAAAAEALARQALAAKPNHRGALYLHGLALLVLGQAEQAIAPLATAAEGNPDPAVEVNLGTALAQAGKKEDALAALKRAASREPPFPPAFHRLGLLLKLMGRVAEAEPVLRRAVELVPDDMGGWLTLGGVLLERGRPEEARGCFSRVVAQAPKLPDGLHGLAQALIDQGEFAQAEMRLREALAQVPGKNSWRLELGFCLQELGRMEEALECYRVAVAAEPQLYRMALGTIVGAARGRLWFRPSAAAKALRHRN